MISQTFHTGSLREVRKALQHMKGRGGSPFWSEWNGELVTLKDEEGQPLWFSSTGEAHEHLESLVYEPEDEYMAVAVKARTPRYGSIHQPYGAIGGDVDTWVVALMCED